MSKTSEDQERLSKEARERYERKINDLITEEEIERACSRIIFGSTPVKLLNTRRCTKDDEQVVQRYIVRRVNNILLLDGPGNMTITTKDWAKYLRDRSVPVGKGFRSYAGTSFERAEYEEKRYRRKLNAAKMLKGMSEKLDEHGIKCDWRKLSVFGR